LHPLKRLKKYLPLSRVVITGNPVRKNVLDAADINLNSISGNKAKKGLSVFIFGGSQGASSLNKAVMSMLSLLSNDILKNLTIFHQTGDRDYESVKNFYNNSGIAIEKFEVFAFTKNIADYYVKSDVVISRSGAGTISELIVMRMPAILVPYPYATKKHQEKNASVFLRKGCFYIAKDDKNLPEELLQTIDKIFYNRKLLNNMRNSIKKIEIRDSVSKIVGIILDKS